MGQFLEAVGFGLSPKLPLWVKMIVLPEKAPAAICANSEAFEEQMMELSFKHIKSLLINP